MPANGTYLVCLTIATLLLLLFLILVVKLHAFVALLISAMAMGLASGMPPDKVLKSIQTGFGDALGFIAVVLGLGAMIGRFLEYSGGGRALADWLLEKFGIEHAAWAMLAAAFLVGLPIFFEVGFIILVPAGVEPRARDQALSPLLRLADGGGADHDSFTGAAASRSRRRHAIARRRPGQHHPLRRRPLLPHGARCRHAVRLLDRAPHVHPRPRHRQTDDARRGDRIRAAYPDGDSAAAASRDADPRRHTGEPAKYSVQKRGGLRGTPVHRAHRHHAGGNLFLRHPPRTHPRQGLQDGHRSAACRWAR